MKMHIKLDPDTEPITTHLSVPCTQSMKERYRELSRRLEQRRQKKVLNREARAALVKVMSAFEDLLNEIERSA